MKYNYNDLKDDVFTQIRLMRYVIDNGNDNALEVVTKRLERIREIMNDYDPKA